MEVGNQPKEDTKNGHKNVLLMEGKVPPHCLNSWALTWRALVDTRSEGVSTSVCTVVLQHSERQRRARRVIRVTSPSEETSPLTSANMCSRPTQSNWTIQNLNAHKWQTYVKVILFISKLGLIIFDTATIDCWTFCKLQGFTLHDETTVRNNTLPSLKSWTTTTPYL